MTILDMTISLYIHIYAYMCVYIYTTLFIYLCKYTFAHICIIFIYLYKYTTAHTHICKKERERGNTQPWLALNSHKSPCLS